MELTAELSVNEEQTQLRDARLMSLSFLLWIFTERPCLSHFLQVHTWDVLNMSEQKQTKTTSPVLPLVHKSEKPQREHRCTVKRWFG